MKQIQTLADAITASTKSMKICCAIAALLIAASQQGCGGSSLPPGLLSQTKIYVLDSGGRTGFYVPGHVQQFEHVGGGQLNPIGSAITLPAGYNDDFTYDESTDSLYVLNHNSGTVAQNARQVVQVKDSPSQLFIAGTADFGPGQRPRAIDVRGSDLFVSCGDPGGGTTDTIYSFPIPSTGSLTGVGTSVGPSKLHSASEAAKFHLVTGDMNGELDFYATTTGGVLGVPTTKQVAAGGVIEEIIKAPAYDLIILSVTYPSGAPAEVHIIEEQSRVTTTVFTMSGPSKPDIACGFVGTPIITALYIADANTGGIQAYELESDGTSTQIGQPLYGVGGQGPMAIIDGTHIAIGSTSDLLVYPIVQTGANEGEIDWMTSNPSVIPVGYTAKRILVVKGP